ncbi:DUF1501 domain-containing protein [Methyloversatilis discipulorum]|uniref:DUF1501 domain-containing protein n=1 Tax=Methyloversatilis discipulorum TaxID=1119528 RepID=UPI003F38BDC9
MNRRDLLKGLFALPLCGGLSSFAHAAPSQRVLVVVFMRGGWDGLNVIVPHGDDTYYGLRPNIAVRPPSDGDSAAALDLDGFFGMHPSMIALHNLYQGGQVAVMPCVHYSASSRSHFAGQDIIESASLLNHDSGWLARYLLQSGGTPLTKALSVSEQLPLSLTGLATPVSAYADLASLQLASSSSDRAMLADVISRSYAWTPPSNNPHGAALFNTGGRLLDELTGLQSVAQTLPANGAAYPMTAFGRQLRQTAALIRAREGLEVVTLNMGGWDTHSNQGGGDPAGRMSVLLKGFSDSVGAFFSDLGGDASRVLMLAVTEFGRTAAENGSRGTDHGNASTWLAIGPNVRGGIHLGTHWPGLTTTQLVDGRALAHTIDFRSVYGSVLSRFLGASNLSAILPEYSGSVLDIVA